MGIVFHIINRYGLLLRMSLSMFTRDSIYNLCQKKKYNYTGDPQEVHEYHFWACQNIVLAEVPGEGRLDVYLGVHDEGFVKIFCIPHFL